MFLLLLSSGCTDETFDSPPFQSVKYASFAASPDMGEFYTAQFHTDDVDDDVTAPAPLTSSPAAVAVALVQDNTAALDDVRQELAVRHSSRAQLISRFTYTYVSVHKCKQL